MSPFSIAYINSTDRGKFVEIGRFVKLLDKNRNYAFINIFDS
jgi:hypothetical protein